MLVLTFDLLNKNAILIKHSHLLWQSLHAKKIFPVSNMAISAYFAKKAILHVVMTNLKTILVNFIARTDGSQQEKLHSYDPMWLREANSTG